MNVRKKFPEAAAALICSGSPLPVILIVKGRATAMSSKSVLNSCISAYSGPEIQFCGKSAPKLVLRRFPTWPDKVDTRDIWPIYWALYGHCRDTTDVVRGTLAVP